MVTSCPFGTTGFECSLVVYLIPALFVMGAILFRKNVANDLLGYDFSIIGSSSLSIISYYIIFAIFRSIRYSVLTGVVFWLIAGFLLGPLLGDGGAE